MRTIYVYHTQKKNKKNKGNKGWDTIYKGILLFQNLVL